MPRAPTKVRRSIIDSYHASPITGTRSHFPSLAGIGSTSCPCPHPMDPVGGREWNLPIPPHIFQGHAVDGCGPATSETRTGGEWVTLGINPAGRSHVSL